MKDKWDEIKDYIVDVKGQVNLLEIHHKTGISRQVIRGLIKIYASETKNCHPIINWLPIEVEIRKQKDLGVIDDLEVAKKFGISKVTVQMHRLYKMGVGARRNDFMVIGTPTLSLVNSSREDIVQNAIKMKCNNLGLSMTDMEIWLHGQAGQNFLTYLVPATKCELDYQQICRDEAA